MGLLLNLIRQVAGRSAPFRAGGAPRVQPISPGASAAQIATAFGEKCEWLEQEVWRLCASGQRNATLALVRESCPRPSTAAQAQTLMRRIVLPLVEACAAHGDAAVACQVEQAVFGNLVKRFEDPAHFEACLGMIDTPMRQLGEINRPEIPPLGATGANNLLFFLHNLVNDLAHTLLLKDLIDAYLTAHPEFAHTVGVAGCCGATASPAIRGLQERWKIAVHRLQPRDGLHRPLQDVAQLIASGAYDRVIVVSAPVAISYLTGLLPPSRIGWLTMKYQLSCFDRLRLRCSFRSGMRREQTVDGRVWLQAAPLFNDNASLKAMIAVPAVLQSARRNKVVLYTINREEKIRHPQFLDRVARILERVDNSVFVWTGREQLPEIDAHFAARGLHDRHLFAGWVVPDDLLQTGDLFLDTPVLSGNVAARATALGIPVVSDAQAITWVGTFLPAYRADTGKAEIADLNSSIEALRAAGIQMQCTGDDEYVEQAVSLATNETLRHQFGLTLAAFAKRYFFNAGSSATDHFMNLRAPVLD